MLSIVYDNHKPINCAIFNRWLNLEWLMLTIILISLMLKGGTSVNSGLRKVLCCCNSYREISLFKSKIKDNYLIATVDYMLYKQLDKKKAIFLESSALINYEKTWGILHEINNAIDRIVRSDSSKYFYLSYNIEGGLPSKISEMVNNLEMIDDIVKKYNLTEFYLFDRKDNWTLNESLFSHMKRSLWKMKNED